MSNKLFTEQLAQGLQMVTVNHFAGLVSMEDKSKAALPAEDKFDPERPGNFKQQFKADPVLCWGAQNKYPNELEEEAKMSSVFEGGMKVLCDTLRGQDLFLYKNVFENGERRVVEVDRADILDELYAIGYYEYWHDACGLLPRWGNVFPIFGLNESSKEIRLIKAYDTFNCRLERPNPDTGKIQNMYVSSQWANGVHKHFKAGEIPSNLEGWIKKFPILDRYNYLNELKVQAGKKYNTFAAHIKYQTSGSAYGRAPWHSLFANRWLGISGKVPEMIMRYYEAAMTINYLIYLDDEWLTKKYPDFYKWKDAERADKIKEIQDSYENNLKGTGNALKSFLLMMRHKDGKVEKNVLIEPVDNKMREGTFIPDSQVADSQVLFTLGLPPALLGAVIPGAKGNEGGSGSNIREASLAMQMRMKPDRELIHTAFYIWRDYKFRNTNDKEAKQLMIGTRDYIINTLDGRAPAAAQVTTPA